MLEIEIGNELLFDTSSLSKELLNKIKKDFRVTNPSFDYEASKKDKYYDTPKYLDIFTMYGDGYMGVPRGTSIYLSEWFDEYGIEYEYVDNRLELEPIDFPDLKYKLFKHQRKWVRKGALLSQGTIESPCGSGKTTGAIALMCRCKQPALIIVPDNELLNQWCQNIVGILGESMIDRIGVITSERIIVDGIALSKGVNDVTIGTNASIHNKVNDKDFVESFGFVVLDECHIVAARTFRETLNSFPAKYRFGLTATPFRNDSLTELITDYCGLKIYEVTDDDLADSGLIVRPELTVIKSKFSYKYDKKYARYVYNKVLKALESNNARNSLIINAISEEIKEKRMTLVICKTVKHCNILIAMLKKEFPKRKSIRIGMLAGNTYDKETTQRAREGNVDVLFAVERAKQGLDIKPLETIVIAAPRKAQGEMEQIVGRVMRADTCFGKYKKSTDKQAKVIDIVDEKVPMLMNAYNERRKVYEDKCETVFR